MLDDSLCDVLQLLHATVAGCDNPEAQSTVRNSCPRSPLHPLQRRQSAMAQAFRQQHVQASLGWWVSVLRCDSDTGARRASRLGRRVASGHADQHDADASHAEHDEQPRVHAQYAAVHASCLTGEQQIFWESIIMLMTM